MRKSLILIAMALVVAIPATASAQYGLIGLYTDETGFNCEMVDAGQGFVDIYVIHTLVAGAFGAAFRLQPSPGFTATHIGHYSPFPTVIGTAPAGVAIGYGTCLSGPILLLRVTYLFDGSSSACGVLEVSGDPRDPHYPNDPIVVDCEVPPGPAKHVVQGGRLVVNPDATCRCVSPVPVRESTWGQIKSLYGE